MTTDEITLKRRTACLSVLSNTLLVIGKLSIGILTGTVSLISEAIHSGVDLLAAAIACLAVRKSCLPPDQDHDYGHGKVENVSAAFESLLIIVAALSILYEAVGKFFHPQVPESLNLAIVIMLASSLINAIVSARLYYVGEKTGSEALKADGMHLRADVWTSAAVMAGIFLMKVTGWAILDPLIACLVALGILRVGYKMCRRSYDDLTDASLSDDEESKIGHIIMETPGVKGYHHLRTRISGSETIMDFHLELDRTLPLSQAHAISDKVESALQKKYGPCDPMIHLDPR
ncbi:cation diffusion facilitator family transporter [Megasphaera hexanoica]|uniref:Cation diffusion facilitator family transporter n=2 Tax=Megasphaera TaxID=906 RepID=A0A848BRQ1_9FIRM|nr:MULTISPECIES: cation diffusion facilitator family transporter [Megasphaera]MCI5532243.1 cation diffusion facilitator family transporter [Caecibacter massiliensis]HAM05263.1 cation transporter [Megasphaera sp.]AXB81182.1 cation transporter [Megasphaera hexanoica]KUH56545.1 cation transporter [Megasphaera sp. DJF_B143]MDY2903938.1 cation diffusion facilitator family transporter [Caecibacter massiliensis]